MYYGGSLNLSEQVDKASWYENSPMLSKQLQHICIWRKRCEYSRFSKTLNLKCENRRKQSHQDYKMLLICDLFAIKMTDCMEVTIRPTRNRSKIQIKWVFIRVFDLVFGYKILQCTLTSQIVTTSDKQNLNMSDAINAVPILIVHLYIND